MTLLVAAVTGSMGAVARYLVSGLTHDATKTDFPVGTLTVNLAGALLLGLAAGVDNLQSLPTVAVAGFSGGFTTFSTWMIETIRLGVVPLRGRAALNLALTLVGGTALVLAGYHLSN